MLGFLPGKTTLSMPGGIALGFGPGPGLASAIFYNGIGSLFSSYRPSVARLTVFDADEPRLPLPLWPTDEAWLPNHAIAEYSSPLYRFIEERTALPNGLATLLRFELTRKQDYPRVCYLCFHGQVQQWPFFDYQASRREPPVRIISNARRRCVTIVQPHPHAGYEDAASVQRVFCSDAFIAQGFALSEADLRTAWHEHGCLESLSLRLGQVGRRLQEEVEEFSHRLPLYYFVIAVRVDPEFGADVMVHTTYELGGGEAAPAQVKPALTFGRADAHLVKNERDWRRYFDKDVPWLESSTPALEAYWHYIWYVLRANRMAPGGHIKHAFTAPSKYMYWGPWIWDGYFHALGEMWMRDASVAADTIRAVLDMQFPNGFIPVCSGTERRMCFHEDISGYKLPGGGGYASYPPSEIEAYEEGAHGFESNITVGAEQCSARHQPEADNGGRSIAPPLLAFTHNEKTQTPLITLAAAEYARLRGGAAFAKEVLPRLLAFDDWLWRRRTDGEGRFILWHGDESGWDNATRHYPVPALPFDVQAHCILHREALIELCVLARDKESRARIEQRIETSRAAIESYWDPEREWYCDLAPGERGAVRRPQIAAAGLFALMLDIPPERVDAICLKLKSPDHFNGFWALSTLSRSDPDYKPHGWGWNGPGWLQVSYFTVLGLLRQRRFSDATKIWFRLRMTLVAEGRLNNFEMYDPESGAGIGCPDYSWQAMLVHLIIRYFAGVDGEVLRPVPPSPKARLALDRLPGAIRSIRLESNIKAHTIAVEYAKPALPLLDSAALGHIKSVTANGLPMRRRADGLWACAPGTARENSWEVVAK